MQHIQIINNTSKAQNKQTWNLAFESAFFSAFDNGTDTGDFDLDLDLDLDDLEPDDELELLLDDADELDLLLASPS